MLRKLTMVILASVVFCGFFSSNIVAGTFEKITPNKIPLDQILPSSPTPLTGDKGFCLIQSDNDTAAWYFAGFQAGDGLALYMDPAQCGLPDPYPFKITDVHFYLYHDSDAGSVWPAEIQVNIRDLIEGDKCNGPGNLLCSQIYDIDSVSAYPEMIYLDLDAFCCVHGPFFLEIVYTGQTNPPYPSMLMTDGATNPADTCDAWVWYFLDDSYYQHYYFEWSDFWSPPPPGYPIMRITGYTQTMECESCWYWKPDRPDQNHPAPSGMPDFGQYQFGDSLALCGPTAIANCLWWFDAVPSDIEDPADFIRLLSNYFQTDPDTGTYVHLIEEGLDQYFRDYGFPLYELTYPMPEFREMEDSLKKSQDIILLIGFWQHEPFAKQWYRIGGHFVTMSGVCSESVWVAFSDPARDMAEYGSPGRVRPVQHPAHTPGDAFHNDPKYVSHDIYQADLQSESPGGVWWLPEYYLLLRQVEFEGQNFQPEQENFFHPYIPAEPVFAEIEYAIMICPTDWYWKPDRPDQDHPAPSGMPDFDQNQFGPPDSVGMCAPTAVANCLWWFDAVPPDIDDPGDFIRLLSDYFKTDPDSGTYVDSIQVGLDEYFMEYGFALKETTYWMPDFYEMEESLEVCQDIILALGFFWYDGEHWWIEGGHVVTMAGVCSESLKIALSDPDRDAAVGGWPGRVRPLGHPAPGGYDSTLHNDPTYVSHDIYTSILDPQNPSPGNPFWEIENYVWEREKYSGKNIPQRFIAYTRPAPKDDAIVWHTEVMAAIMICPKTTGVEDEGEESAITPKDFELYQSYPNPFNNQTIIKYNLLKSCEVNLTIYNILGQRVKTLVEGYQEAGTKSINWDGKDEKGKDLASGIYFYQLRAGEVAQTKRMVLLK
ncbi:MAG: T9SS type A sorting domain-containing protein [candidate division Zixibacteria bacterium]|nr:T9SS type A sorting domain-containing protein [candidate division Zixibacteria bacterium]